MGGGFQRICKMYGALVINGQRYVWDYANDEGVREEEMPAGSERRKASDKALAEWLAQSSPQNGSEG